MRLLPMTHWCVARTFTGAVHMFCCNLKKDKTNFYFKPRLHFRQILLQFIVKFIRNIGYRGTKWSVQASHYKCPFAAHMNFDSHIFSGCHRQIHQRLGWGSVVTNDAPTMPGMIFTPPATVNALRNRGPIAWWSHGNKTKHMGDTNTQL